ncbi:MAG: metallophosphoesterase [Deltaproteobacteria bacterium]|nr:metallophosphoesterase [Deltaproteobacteria bacterium]
MSAPLILGLVLTFGHADGRTLQLTVTLAEPATVALDWGNLRLGKGQAERRHVFTELPAPAEEAVGYRLRAGHEQRAERVEPLLGSPLKVGLYGDSRDGPGPHQVLVEALAAWGPQVVVHTGDVVHQAGDEVGWSRHLAASLPLSARVPVILAVGNHELWQPWDLPPEKRRDAVAEVLAQIPAPVDPLARSFGLGPHVFHVRIGGHLFVSLDSNDDLGPGSAQLRFLEATLAQPDTQTRFVALHHGPLSSGPHGGHPQGEALIQVAEQGRVTAVLSGHDHLYERLGRGAVSYLVSGGGGAPLYPRDRYALGSVAFASIYHWVALELAGPEVKLSAYSLEGALLDQAQLPAPTDATKLQAERLPWLGAGAGVLALVLMGALLSLALARRPGSG